MSIRKTLIVTLANLLKVKSLTTLAIIATTCYLAIEQWIPVEVFTAFVSAVITYYFTKPNSEQDGTEAKKTEPSDNM